MNLADEFDEFDALFAPGSPTSAGPVPVETWKVLLVDDEPAMHAALRLALQDVVVQGRTLQLIDARSSAECKLCLAEHPDVALVLLDVVMETGQAGLDLVQYIRHELDNPIVQIILITGQPGYAPMRDVVQRYEISGYRLKSELNAERIFAFVYAAIRAYQVMAQMEQQRRQLENQAQVLQRWRHIFEHTEWGVVVGDVDGRCIEMANPAFTRLLGYDANELTGQPIVSLFSTDERVHVPGYIAKAHERGYYSFEARFSRKNGSIFPVMVNVTAVKDEAGQVLYRVATVEDITERKRTESEIRRLNEQLEARVQARTADLHAANQLLATAKIQAEAANVAKSTFLANMSHEIRTPLSAILGFANLMRERQETPEQQRRNLDIICSSAQQLLGLVNGALDMAKIDSGGLQIDLSVIDLSGLLRDVTDQLRLHAQDKGLHLTLEPSSRLPHFVKTDAAKLRQTLLNLIGNAIKFTEHGGVTLRVKAVAGEEAQQLLTMEIQDTGIGIAAAEQSRIFEPFVQLGRIPSSGSGLGLTITRNFVRTMGGHVRVQSQPGKGSIFRLDWPVERADEPMSTECPKHLGRVLGLAPGQGEFRIMVVDDQVENALLLTEILAFPGLQVRVANSGAQALALYATWQPHLVWMDIRMAGMDGLEATRQIRTLPGGQRVKIVALTASVFQEQLESLRAAGFNGIVLKPYQVDDIYLALAQHLDIRFAREPASGAS